MKALELKVPPVILTLLFGAAMWAVSRVLPSGYFAFPGRFLLFAVVLVAGAVIALMGVLAFRRAGTTVDPRTPHQTNSLVVGGVYRHTRNPMYVGFLMILAAWWLYLGSVFAALLLPLYVLYMNRFQIKPEERHMRDLFGDQFNQYAERVRRWL
ncbi:protein-S-isoprenylcysteine O-methyltransferase Ste14 [Marinobacter sp. MBR-99]|uniref:methyltransferase family protein n=1 Tax=Marinobacter TaxID=2742 RepID=UPI000D0FAFC8|nr:isoprenylcysteine carboxylmethyltransferase family protein [Marinobacter shengliensis]PSF11455.1 isoprenylcysteine carboxylmethyltransferase family protein [Marinobacter shengliensis]